MEKLCKVSLLRNLKCRNFRGFLLQSAGDRDRDVCTFASHAMLDGIFYWTFFFFFSSHTLPSPLHTAAQVATHVWLEIKILTLPLFKHSSP